MSLGQQFLLRLAGLQCLHRQGQAVQTEDKVMRSFETSETTHPATHGYIPRGLNFQRNSIIRLLKLVIETKFVYFPAASLINIPTELFITAYFTYFLLLR
jgi:hypothetical protein